MLVSYVLRLAPDHLAEGELVGEVEEVASGERAAVASPADLVAFCTATCPPCNRHGGSKT